MKKPDIFLFALISFIFGIICRLKLDLLQSILLGIFIFGMALVIKKEKIFWIFLIIFLLGVIRADLNYYFLENSQLKNLNDKDQEIILIGKIVKEPQKENLKQKLVVKIEKIFNDNLKKKEKVLIYIKNQKEYIVGEKIRVTGELKTPPKFEDFDYKKYLNQQGIISVIYYPEIETIKEAPIFYKLLFKTKEKLRQIIDESLFYPENFLLRAMILGDKKEMPKEIKEKFNKSGIRHITAISGMHITILINILIAFLIGMGLWRKRAVLITIIFISFYILLIGFQPSAIRAAIMGFGLILAQVLGRLPDAIRFLLFAAVIMLSINPFLFYNIGFQLSFLAAAGINYLTPFFNSKLKKIPKSGGIRNILAMTFSAQVFTLPLLLYHFGYFSLLSPISNLLIVPLIPFIIGFGFLALLIGLIAKSLSLLLFLPLSFLLGYITFVANLFSKFSFFALNTKISLVLLIMYYFCLFFVVKKIIKKRQYWFLEM
jgi:competence protein ComEC